MEGLGPFEALLGPFGSLEATAATKVTKTRRNWNSDVPCRPSLYRCVAFCARVGAIICYHMAAVLMFCLGTGDLVSHEVMRIPSRSAFLELAAGAAGATGATGVTEVVSRTAAQSPPSTRAGGQDDGSYTNSLK